MTTPPRKPMKGVALDTSKIKRKLVLPTRPVSIEEQSMINARNALEVAYQEIQRKKRERGEELGES